MGNGNHIDIVRNMAQIEKVKSGLLTGVARLYDNMGGAGGREENDDLLADIIINSYLLADKMGIGASGVDTRVLSKLKAQLSTDSPMEKEKKRLYGYFQERNQ